MSETEDNPTAVIGRGESIITKKHPNTDVEADDSQELAKTEDEIKLIKESEGWLFPKIKLSSWDPEHEKQWEATGQFIARRNLIASIPNLTCGFGVWLVWSGKGLCFTLNSPLNSQTSCWQLFEQQYFIYGQTFLSFSLKLITQFYTSCLLQCPTLYISKNAGYSHCHENSKHS